MCGKKGEERTSSIANAVCMDNYIIIIILLLLDIIGSPGSAIMQAKKKRMGNYGNCTSNALPVLEDNMHVNASKVQLELPAG